MGIEPHADEPPGASQIADGFTKQKLFGYLMKEEISKTQEVSVEKKSATTG